jgi:hypothetical protein
METPITVEYVLGFLAILGGVAGVWWRIEAKLVEEATARKASTDRLWEESRRIDRDIADYKLFVERNHVSAAALRETEERLITAVEKLAARMEAIGARLEKMSIDMAGTAKSGRP